MRKMKKIEYLSTKQVSECLGLHSRTIKRMVKKGKIRAVRFGRLLKYRRSDIEKYFEMGTDFVVKPVERSDRRSYPRINTNLKCCYSINLAPFKQINSEGIIKDLSAGGVFLFDKDNEVNINDPVQMRFGFGDATGKVVRKASDGVGIKFKNLKGEIKNRIVDYAG